MSRLPSVIMALVVMISISPKIIFLTLSSYEKKYQRSVSLIHSMRLMMLLCGMIFR